MLLYPTPDNPIPGEPAVAALTTADGLTLRAVRWHPDGPVQGTVCILQGRAEFVEKYFETAADLLLRGFAVATFDWRGQGLSARQVGNPRKGYVRSFDDFRKDLETVRDQWLIPFMPEPHFALCHSMGGAIALSEAAAGRLPFRRLVTTAPMIGLSITKRPKGAAQLASILNLLGFGRSFIPGGGETSISRLPFAGNFLTSDPRRYARNGDAATAVGAGAIGAPTISWINAAFRLMRTFQDPRFGLKVRVPTLIVAAGADPVCSTAATERLAARLKAGHAIVIPGARHEILMERDDIREQFWAAFDAFIPGSPDSFGRRDPVALAMAESVAEELERGSVDAAVTGGDDGAARGS